MNDEVEQDVENEISSHSPLKVRDKGFAKRLEQAMSNHPRVVVGRGRQKWLREELLNNYDVKVSPEAVRKWIAGHIRPKPKVMALIARALGVDEAWLSLGVAPTASPAAKRKQSALANGAVNMVAAHIQLSGSNIAFPEDATDVDLFAIVNGKHLRINVRPVGEGKFSVNLPLDNQVVIFVMPTDAPTVYRFLTVSPEQVSEAGKIRGNYIELECELVSDRVLVANRAITEIKDFSRLDTVLDRK